jgi:5'-AMP-activated protein kinase regulatory gamma subunit
MDERLYDACFKITKSGISRLFVIEPESKMFMGIIHQKDILVFLIKGFT